MSKDKSVIDSASVSANTKRLKEMQVKSQESKLLSIAEAAEIHNVTRQAIYVAIKLKKLKAHKEHSRWVIRNEDLEDYRSYRYCRSRSVFGGEPLFDNHKGYFSVNQVAERLGIPAQKVYYATRAGLLKGTRKGAAWVFHEMEVVNYKKNYLDKVPARRKAS